MTPSEALIAALRAAKPTVMVSGGVEGISARPTTDGELLALVPEKARLVLLREEIAATPFPRSHYREERRVAIAKQLLVDYSDTSLRPGEAATLAATILTHEEAGHAKGRRQAFEEADAIAQRRAEAYAEIGTEWYGRAALLNAAREYRALAVREGGGARTEGGAGQGGVGTEADGERAEYEASETRLVT